MEVNQCIPDCDPVEVARGECGKYKMMTCATPGAVPVIQAPPPAPLMPLCIYISENMLGATTDVYGTWETSTYGPISLPAGAVAEEVGGLQWHSRQRTAADDERPARYVEPQAEGELGGPWPSLLLILLQPAVATEHIGSIARQMRTSHKLS